MNVANPLAVASMAIASLPMYDWPEFKQETDAFWQGFAKHAKQAGSLHRQEDYAALWHNPQLIFSQTCGYPFTHNFKDILAYVATPHYQAEGCKDANYCSIIFAREQKNMSDFFGSNAAINTQDSMSGMLALKLVFAPHVRGGEFFRRVKFSGGHRNSLRAVRTKYADVCAVDSVCVALAHKYCPQELDGLVEIARSPMVPTLPFVTRAGVATQLVEALEKTFADPDLAKTRDALLLKGFSVLPEGAYDRILELEKALPPFNL
jgi:ABC-type phosphate/phosphonate transport system substrate-binding protein